MTAVARSRAELAALRGAAAAKPAAQIAVVMTMGALHAGHAELVRRARAVADVVIVTDFLNPLQFAPGEDLDVYPRTFDADLALCRAEGVDVLFAPDDATVYPSGEPSVRIQAGPVGDVLEGAARPGHFDGVLTVVAKLLHLTAAQLAFFGRKDAQQLWLITRMVRDLDFDVEVVGVPTVRDSDGLALSSRNTYLTARDRSAALVLSRALGAATATAAAKASPHDVVSTATTVVHQEPQVRPDYVALVDPGTFQPVAADHHGAALLLLAAHVGSTRLIDNTTVHLRGRHGRDAARN